MPIKLDDPNALEQLTEKLSKRRQLQEMMKEVNAVIRSSKSDDAKIDFIMKKCGKSREEARAEERKQWEEMTIEDHMEVYTKQGMDKKSAMKAVAKDRGVSKRDIYQYLESRK